MQERKGVAQRRVHKLVLLPPKLRESVFFESRFLMITTKSVSADIEVFAQIKLYSRSLHDQLLKTHVPDLQIVNDLRYSSDQQPPFTLKYTIIRIPICC